MSRFTFVVRTLFLLVLLPTALFLGVVLAITGDWAFSLVATTILTLACSGLFVEALGEYRPVVLPPAPVSSGNLPMTAPRGLMIVAEIRLDELVAHRRRVYAAGGQIVQSSPIGSVSNDRYLVRSLYPTNDFN